MTALMWSCCSSRKCGLLREAWREYTRWIHKICLRVGDFGKGSLLSSSATVSLSDSAHLNLCNERRGGLDFYRRSGTVALPSRLHSQQTPELLCSLIWYLISRLYLIVTVLRTISLPLICLLPSDEKSRGGGHT